MASSAINFLLFALSVFVAVGGAQSPITFVSPPPAGPNSVYTDDPVFVLGYILKIEWKSQTSDFISLVMYQQRPNDTFEYIFRLTSYEWTIGTSKNLSESNVFFEIFISGQTEPSAVSHYFNLTKAAGLDSEPSTTTSGTSVPSTTSTSILLTNTTSSTATTTRATSSPTVAATSSGLSTSAKAGIGVGISLAVIAGCLAGFFLFRHYGRKDDNAPPPASAVPYMFTPPVHEPKGMSMGPQWPVASTLSSSDVRRDKNTSPVEMPADHQI
ncbi:hypothetical protein T310_1874 [Rasamsonia emersonii CBS 393.64]|uniref:Mid2 domain-containing protein n=1 Tax=Rasamsonia emersonii (strain ATCC 16479 / CBS 393.64 / IMI 116815) TaxID=1408163 RepID=A0A0F4Z0L0_RASE3|nr:hypothetical protein T310_1874 [Rasamsonia emersonii CBS 393.64]KKA24062.1 hypothetical protein T310_1874 [Rasamsonia emersonii CBS 393.64]